MSGSCLKDDAARLWFVMPTPMAFSCVRSIVKEFAFSFVLSEFFAVEKQH
jgi:hypothetical protein